MRQLMIHAQNERCTLPLWKPHDRSANLGGALDPEHALGRIIAARVNMPVVLYRLVGGTLEPTRLRQTLTPMR